MTDAKSPGDILALLVTEYEVHDAMANLPAGHHRIAEFQAMLPKLVTQIDTALRRFGFTDVDQTRARLQLPVQRMFRARQAAFEHIVQLAREDELDRHE